MSLNSLFWICGDHVLLLATRTHRAVHKRNAPHTHKRTHGACWVRYTTKLHQNNITEEQARKAERMAREIEGQATDNMHIAEERGQVAQRDDDLDEEDRYSGVLVRGANGSQYNARGALFDQKSGNGRANGPPSDDGGAGAAGSREGLSHAQRSKKVWGNFKKPAPVTQDEEGGPSEAAPLSPHDDPKVSGGGRPAPTPTVRAAG